MKRRQPARRCREMSTAWAVTAKLRGEEGMVESQGPRHGEGGRVSLLYTTVEGGSGHVCEAARKQRNRRDDEVRDRHGHSVRLRGCSG